MEANPVVAAIKDDDGLKRCLESDIDVVFVLYGDVISIRDIVHRLKKGNKTVLVHVDLISGLAPKEVSVDFIRKYTEADGIITTRRNLTEYAKSLGMNTVLRYFMIDSLVLENIKSKARRRFSRISLRFFRQFWSRILSNESEKSARPP